MTIAELKTKRDELNSKARSLKTKAAKDKVYKQICLIDRQLCDALYEARDKYGHFSIKGIVHDFAGRGEEILVKTIDGDLLWLSPDNDVLSKSWYPETCCIEYTKGQSVVIECSVETDLQNACLRLLPGKIHGGRVNEQKYQELCKRDDLAFFKYPQGMTGLIK
jgi:hypothetical protein